MNVQRIIGSLVRVDTDAQSNRSLGRVGGLLFGAAGATVAVTAPFVPIRGSIAPLLLTALLCAVAGLISFVIPWHRWPRHAILGQSIVAVVLIAGCARAAPGALDHYMPMYTVIFVYAGLTQRLRALLVLVPAAVGSFLVGVVGTAPPSTYLNFTITLSVSTMAAIALGGVMGRQRRGHVHIESLLETTRALSRCESVVETVNMLDKAITAITSADAVSVVLAEEPGSNRFLTVHDDGVDAQPQLSVDILNEPSIISTALAQGEAVFVADAAADERCSPHMVSAFGARSSLCLPLAGEGGRLGVLFLRWNRVLPAERDPFVDQALAIIATEGGLVLERLRANERVQLEAATDPLTALFNRRAIDRRLQRLNPGDSVVIIDLDRFKDVNDVHGHAAGDRTLRAMAGCMLENCRRDDWCGRFGGDEFIMVLRHGGAEGAQAVIRQLRDAWGLTAALTTFSAGIAVHGEGAEPRRTVARADQALYQAKDAGRNRSEASPIDC